MTALPRRVLAFALVVASAMPAFAGPKMDLERIKPVPADEPIPIVDFFRAPLLIGAHMNPSGTRISALVTAAEDQHSLLVYDTRTQKFSLVVGSSDQDVYSSHWLTDDRLLYSVTFRKQYDLGLFAADLTRGVDAYPLLQYAGASVVCVPDADRVHPLVWMRHQLERPGEGGVAVLNTNNLNGQMVKLYSSDTRAGDVSLVRRQNEQAILSSFPLVPEGLAMSYRADVTDKLAFATSMINGVEMLWRLEGERWVKCPVDLDEIEILGSGNKPGELLVGGPHQPGIKPRAVQLLNAATGELGEVLLQDEGYDFSGWVIRDPETREIIGLRVDRNGPHNVWFTQEQKALQQVLNARFGGDGQVIEIVSRSRTGNKFVIRRYSDRQPDIYDWVDLDSKQAGLIKHSRPWIATERMRPMQIFKYKTRDGHRMDAYLTLPAGASKENPVPMVVLPHGGPWVRDSWGFNPEAQFLASRGYAVLQPNYRGSTGYDWMFPRADRYEFVKMYEDVADATSAALRTKLIDESRIAIVGGSFGGHLALTGVTSEPSRYRCAVGINGVYDWADMIREQKYDQYSSGAYGYLRRWIGDPKEHREKYDRFSSLRRVSEIRVPVLVIHAKEDHRVAVGQGRDLVSALARHKVPHETLFLSGEGHGVAHLEKRVEMYERIETFLARHLKGAAGTR